MSGRGEARYRLTLDHADFESAIDAVTRQFEEFGSTLAKAFGVGGAFALGEKAAEALAESIKAVPEAALAAVEHLSEFSHEVEIAEAKTGLSAKAVQELGVAAKLSGSDIGTMTSMVGKMEKGIVAGSASFGQLGLSVKQLRAEAPEQAFKDVSDAIQNIKNPTEQTAAAMAVFGKSGQEALSLIKQGAGDLMQEAGKLGAVLSDEDIKAAAELRVEGTKLGIAWEAVQNQFAAGIVTSGALQTLFQGLVKVMADSANWMGKNKDTLRGWADQGAIYAANALVGLMTVLEGGMAVFTTLEDVWTGLTTSGKVLAATLELVATATFKPTSMGAAWKQYQATLDGALTDAARQMDAHEKQLASVVGVAEKARATLVKLASDVASHAGTVAGAGGGGGGGTGTGTFAGAGDAAERARIAKLEEETTGKVRLEAVKMVNKDLEDEYKANVKHIQFILDEQVVKDKERAAIDKQAIESQIHLIDMEAEHYKLLGGVIGTLGAAFAGFAGGIGMVGGALGGLGQAYEGLAQHSKQAEQNFLDTGNEAMNTGQKVMAGAQAAAGAMAIYKAQQYNRSGGSGAIGGAEAGAATGAQYGPVGAIVGAIAGGIIGFFAGSKFRDACKTAGATLGGYVSDELGKAIMKTASDDKISTSAASLLHISDFVADDKTGSRSIDSMGPQIDKLMASIANGSVPAKAGMDELNKDFDQLATNAAKGDVAAQKLTADLIQQGIATGKLTDSMQAFITDAMGGMAGGADKILAGIQLIKAPLGTFGTAAAEMFTAGFTAEIAQKGIVQALEDQGKGIQDLYKKLSDEGNTAAAAMLAPWQQLSAAINNDADPSVKGFLETLQGMSDVFGGIVKLGFATQGSFQALETGVQGATNAMAEAGVTGPAAYQAIAPELAQIIAAHDKYGFAIDADTQKLIDQAKAAGVAFPVDPVTAMVQAVHDLIDAIDTMNGLPTRNWGSGPPAPPDTGTSGSGSGGGGNGAGPGEAPPMASGGYVPATARGSLRRIGEGGEGEYVVPKSNVLSFARAAMGSGGGGGSAGGGATGGVSIGEIHVHGVNDPLVFARQVQEVVDEAVRNNRGGLASRISRVAKGA